MICATSVCMLNFIKVEKKIRYSALDIDMLTVDEKGRCPQKDTFVLSLLQTLWPLAIWLFGAYIHKEYFEQELTTCVYLLPHVLTNTAKHAKHMLTSYVHIQTQ